MATKGQTFFQMEREILCLDSGVLAMFQEKHVQNHGDGRIRVQDQIERGDRGRTGGQEGILDHQPCGGW